MRAYKILFAVLAAAMMLAVPMITVPDMTDAEVQEQSSAVYFKSHDDLSPEVLAKFMEIDVSAASIETILEATGDFNFGPDGFSISEIRTSNYNVESGLAARISATEYQNEKFSIVSMDIEFKLTAKSDNSKLFAEEFNGDAAYGFIKSLPVKQNDVITFRGTLRTEESVSIEKSAVSTGEKYVIRETKADSAEKTELILDAVFRPVNGAEQPLKFSNSFSGYGTHNMSQSAEQAPLATLGELYTADVLNDVQGIGHVSMEIEGRTYSADSRFESFKTVYAGVRSTDYYSGKQTCTYTSDIVMTEDQYKAQYSEVKLKDLFNKFTGTNQELMGCIGTIGSMDVDDFGKVEERANAVITDVKGQDQKDTSLQITNVVIVLLVAVVIVLAAEIVILHRKKKRF